MAKPNPFVRSPTQHGVPSRQPGRLDDVSVPPKSALKGKRVKNHWYQNRWREIQKAGSTPKNSTKWRAALSTIRAGPITKLRTLINAACDKFLQGDLSYWSSEIQTDVFWNYLQLNQPLLLFVDNTFQTMPLYAYHSPFPSLNYSIQNIF